MSALEGAQVAHHSMDLVSECGSENPLERVNSFSPRCFEARLLGFCLRSSSFVVVDFDGRFRFARTVKRTSAEDRWAVVS